MGDTPPKELSPRPGRRRLASLAGLSYSPYGLLLCPSRGLGPPWSSDPRDPGKACDPHGLGSEVTSHLSILFV